MDNIVLVIPTKHVTKILETFNNFHDRIQFTIEYEKNRSISFLNLLLRVRDDTLMIDWFHKGTFSGRHLFFYSNYPLCHKIDTIWAGGQSDSVVSSRIPKKESRTLH